MPWFSPVLRAASGIVGQRVGFPRPVPASDGGLPGSRRPTGTSRTSRPRRWRRRDPTSRFTEAGFNELNPATCRNNGGANSAMWCLTRYDAVRRAGWAVQVSPAADRWRWVWGTAPARRTVR